MSGAGEYLLKVRGDAIGIAGELELGADVQVLVTGTVVAKTQRDNDDGTYDLIHLVKGTYASGTDV